TLGTEARFSRPILRGVPESLDTTQGFDDKDWSTLAHWEKIMNSPYIATIRQNPGRRALIVEFRHPLRPDPSNQGKPGRKVRKGLGTGDRAAAETLVADLNRILNDPSLHSSAARARAEAMFDDHRV